MASVATAVWSAAQMATGFASGFATMLVTRLGLGIGEVPFAPVTYRSVRAWAPYPERGTAIGAISAGSSLGLALGAPIVAWLIEAASWRWSFIITGAVGFIWVAVWLAVVSAPGKDALAAGSGAAAHLRRARRRRRAAEPWGVGYLGLIRCPAMWGLFISQGCLVYSVYLYMRWLPNYLQTARGLSLVGSGIFTSIPFLAASVVNIIANWAQDRVLSAHGVRSGKRRYLVAVCLLLTAAGLAIPFVQSLAAVVLLVSIAASFGNVGPAANGALVSDLLRSPADAGRVFAFLVLGGNSFGLLAPIVTGYLVAATGNLNSAFILAGALALLGASVTLALARTPIGEVPPGGHSTDQTRGSRS